jgi:hypothetical protein
MSDEQSSFDEFENSYSFDGMESPDVSPESSPVRGRARVRAPPPPSDASPVRDANPARNTMSSGWVYTLPNYGMDDVHRLRALHTDRRNKVLYHVFQPEVGDSGLNHLQGYIEFETRKRFTTVKRLLDERAHLESRRGTPREASDYCKKEDTRADHLDFGIFEVGELPAHEPGKRNDLLTVKKALDDGKHLWAIAQDDDDLAPTVLRNHRSLGMYEQHVQAPRDHRTHLHIHEGDPGTYKSFAASQYPNAYALENGNSGTWFDGYEPNKHETILADEFGGHFMPYTTLKRLCDRYAMMVETKGGRTIFKGRRVVITSNITPDQWYPKYPFAELERRVTSWFTYTRTQAPIYGLPVGAITVEKKKGDWRNHPLYEVLKVIDGQENIRQLDEEIIKEEFEGEELEDFDYF